jgi:DNA-directed RNA polymerase subunit RPC12/RpoP
MSDFTEPTRSISNELACQGCGALLKFKPGTYDLVCEYCGAHNEIAKPEVAGQVQEINLDDFLANNFKKEETVEVAVVKCENCGATTTLSERISSDKCPFCASSLVVKSGTTASLHKPQYVLPFGIDDKKATGNFKSWLRGLWFAPGDLKHYADSANRLSGMYLPFWTFDCSTESSYTGQRGENYTVTESYTAVENGRNVNRTRQVVKTRWYPASGRVRNTFDDVLIEATTSLRQDKLRALEPWDLNKLMPYNDGYLSGFRTETYSVDVKGGYQEAKQVMEPRIHATIREDIGGDQQMIQYVKTTYRNPTFKHILLPVWLSAYRYNNKVYQFLVNARSGEVQGERPYSAIKIALAVIAGLIIIGIIYVLGTN